MASKLSIISGAAVRLGEPPVVSLDEDTKTAQSGNALYDTILESTLSMHRWRFATGKVNLSLLAAAPLNEWSYAYQLPTNPKVMSIIKVYPRMNYERYEDKLYCNTNTGVAIDYVYLAEPSAMPPWFVEVMELRMAMAMAVPVTGSRSLKQEMQAELRGDGMQAGMWGMAQAADAKERPGDGIVSSPLTDRRR